MRYLWPSSEPDTGQECDYLRQSIERPGVRRLMEAMTVAVILGGLAPIMWSLSAPLLSMFVIPAAYLLMRRRVVRKEAS